jgi:transposase InsO family protein
MNGQSTSLAVHATEQIRTDEGSQFTATLYDELMKYLGIQHFVMIPYKSQANGIMERRNGEVLKQLRAIVMIRRVKEKWSRFLPIAQNVLNNVIDSSLGKTPSRILFCNSIKSTVEWIMN